MGWYAIKESIELFSGLDMDALHVHAGLLVQIGVALLMRRSLASAWPWLVVLVAAVANEAYDLAYETWPDPERARQFAEGIRDVWNTMLMPTLLLILVRWVPGLFTRRVEPAEPALGPATETIL